MEFSKIFKNYIIQGVCPVFVPIQTFLISGNASLHIVGAGLCARPLRPISHTCGGAQRPRRTMVGEKLVTKTLHTRNLEIQLNIILLHVIII